MTKKIFADPSTGVNGNVMGYTYPVYHDHGKNYYIDFKCFDPVSERLKRKKIMLDNIKNKRERLRYANMLISTLANKLREGWNPWADMSTYRGYTPINDVLDRYLEHVGKMSRKKTIHSYTSRVNVFREFLNIAKTVRYVYQFDRQLVVDFLDWLLIDRDVSPRTYNNYRGWIGTLGEYLVDRKFLEDNPSAGIPKMREDQKKRKPLSGDMLRRLYAFLNEHDRYFLLAVMMEYYTFIRPSELVGLRLNDFKIREQNVFVAGSISKNGRDGFVGLNGAIIRLMIELKVFDHPGNSYLFSKDFRPGERQMGPDIFNKRWTQYRKRLQWGDEYQFYSLKDSGIRDLANEEGIVIARDQARHTDISTTNKYLGPEDGVRPETKTFTGNLS